MKTNSGVSGKKVVYVLFLLAVILALIVFRVGLSEKRKRLDGMNHPGVPHDQWKENSKVFP